MFNNFITIIQELDYFFKASIFIVIYRLNIKNRFWKCAQNVFIFILINHKHDKILNFFYFNILLVFLLN